MTCAEYVAMRDRMTVCPAAGSITREDALMLFKQIDQMQLALMRLVDAAERLHRYVEPDCAARCKAGNVRCLVIAAIEAANEARG